MKPTMCHIEHAHHIVMCMKGSTANVSEDRTIWAVYTLADDRGSPHMRKHLMRAFLCGMPSIDMIGKSMLALNRQSKH